MHVGITYGHLLEAWVTIVLINIDRFEIELDDEM